MEEGREGRKDSVRRGGMIMLRKEGNERPKKEDGRDRGWEGRRWKEGRVGEGGPILSLNS